MQSPIVPVECPENAGNFVRLVSPRVNNPVSGVVYSSQVVGFNTHYLGGRTTPCLGDGPQCIGHVEGLPVRWKGFLLGYSNQTHATVIFELPAQTVRSMEELRTGGADLRGAAIRLIRVGPNANSPVKCELRLDAFTSKLPKEEPDVIKWLSLIWGIVDPGEAIYATEGGRGG